jgi:hypothetical protein
LMITLQQFNYLAKPSVLNLCPFPAIVVPVPSTSCGLSGSALCTSLVFHESLLFFPSQ